MPRGRYEIRNHGRQKIPRRSKSDPGDCLDKPVIKIDREMYKSLCQKEKECKNSAKIIRQLKNDLKKASEKLNHVESLRRGTEKERGNLRRAQKSPEKRRSRSRTPHKSSRDRSMSPSSSNQKRKITRDDDRRRSRSPKNRYSSDKKTKYSNESRESKTSINSNVRKDTDKVKDSTIENYRISKNKPIPAVRQNSAAYDDAQKSKSRQDSRDRRRSRSRSPYRREKSRICERSSSRRRQNTRDDHRRQERDRSTHNDNPSSRQREKSRDKIFNTSKTGNKSNGRSESLSSDSSTASSKNSPASDVAPAPIETEKIADSTNDSLPRQKLNSAKKGDGRDPYSPVPESLPKNFPSYVPTRIGATENKDKVEKEMPTRAPEPKRPRLINSIQCTQFIIKLKAQEVAQNFFHDKLERVENNLRRDVYKLQCEFNRDVTEIFEILQSHNARKTPQWIAGQWLSFYWRVHQVFMNRAEDSDSVIEAKRGLKDSESSLHLYITRARH